MRSRYGEYRKLYKCESCGNLEQTKCDDVCPNCGRVDQLIETVGRWVMPVESFKEACLALLGIREWKSGKYEEKQK